MNFVKKHKIISSIVILAVIAIMITTVIMWGTSKPSANELPSDVIPRTSTPEKSIAESTKELKASATEADFVKLNGHANEYVGLKVFARGEISMVDYKYVFDKMSPSFALTQHQGDGYGEYHILNVANVQDLKNGDSVIIYGEVIGGTDEITGLTIKIMASVIEKQ